MTWGTTWEMRLSYTGSHGQDLETFNDVNQVHGEYYGVCQPDAAVPDLEHYPERGEPGG